MTREQLERSHRDRRHRAGQTANLQSPARRRRPGQSGPPVPDARTSLAYDETDMAAEAIDLSDIRALRAVLRRHGLRPNKAFGQHMLVDRDVLATLVEAAEISPLDDVLEVGAGPGVLTLELAKHARRVVAVELDQHILPVLRETTAHLPRVEILPTDLLAVDPNEV